MSPVDLQEEVKRLATPLVELELELKRMAVVKRKEGMVQLYIRRLHDLVHALGAQGALDQITDGYGADECGETGILTLLFGGAVLEDLCWAEGRLCGGRLTSLEVGT